MKQPNETPETPKSGAFPGHWRRVESLMGVALLLWLAGIVTAAAMKAWLVLALLIAGAVITVRVLQVLAYRD